MELEKKGKAAFLKSFYKLFYRIFRLASDNDIPLDASEFGLMDKKAVQHINSMPEKLGSLEG